MTTPSPSSTSTPIRSEKVVQATAERVDMPAGGSAELTVRVAIDEGYHVNANPPSYSYLIATELAVPNANGLSSGKVSYPTALKKKFEFAENDLAVYEGQVELKTMLKADTSASKGEHTIPATLRVQACDNQVCYPPGTINLQISVSIR